MELLMPLNLTRSLLTILIPGLVAIAPWLLLLLQRTDATLGLKDYPTIAHALIFSCIVVVGSILEGMGTFVESRWDQKRNGELDIYGDWYAYLSSTESTVGHRYLSRLVTSLYFELSMLSAVPLFILGSAFLAALRFSSLRCVIAVGSLFAVILAIRYFWWQAYETHNALCVTRQKLRALKSGAD
jgi:hypothetical protein